jgi:hypothetical protein
MQNPLWRPIVSKSLSLPAFTVLGPMARAGAKLQAASTGLNYEGDARPEGRVFRNTYTLNGKLAGYWFPVPR